jgi:phage gp45-like
MNEGVCFLRVLTATEGELGIYHHWGELLTFDMNNILIFGCVQDITSVAPFLKFNIPY